MRVSAIGIYRNLIKSTLTLISVYIEGLSIYLFKILFVKCIDLVYTMYYLCQNLKTESYVETI